MHRPPDCQHLAPRPQPNSGSQASLTSVYVLGNAPSPRLLDLGGPFDGDYHATVYYLPGTSGWTSTYGGLPTALWARPEPMILTAGSNLGVQANGFGFTISWATNHPVVVEASTDITQAAWSPVSTNILTDGWSYFTDPNWTNHPARFYRLRAQ